MPIEPSQDGDGRARQNIVHNSCMRLHFVCTLPATRACVTYQQRSVFLGEMSISKEQYIILRYILLFCIEHVSLLFCLWIGAYIEP